MIFEAAGGAWLRSLDGPAYFVAVVLLGVAAVLAIRWRRRRGQQFPRWATPVAVVGTVVLIVLGFFRD